MIWSTAGNWSLIIYLEKISLCFWTSEWNEHAPIRSFCAESVGSFVKFISIFFTVFWHFLNFFFNCLYLGAYLVKIFNLRYLFFRLFVSSKFAKIHVGRHYEFVTVQHAIKLLIQLSHNVEFFPNKSNRLLVTNLWNCSKSYKIIWVFSVSSPQPYWQNYYPPPLADMLSWAVWFKFLLNKVIANTCLFILTSFSKQSASWKVLEICELCALSTD